MKFIGALLIATYVLLNAKAVRLRNDAHNNDQHTIKVQTIGHHYFEPEPGYVNAYGGVVYPVFTDINGDIESYEEYVSANERGNEGDNELPEENSEDNFEEYFSIRH